MQRLIVMYDISDDRARDKVSTACLDYGLDRLQYSVFVGVLSRNHQEELMMCVDDHLLDVGGKVILIPISENDWRKVIEVDYA